jgi:CRISPR/Cas system-associated exonuclease Cas4 (RecB family)
MTLPEGFQFSQGSLQDFVDCRRRFQLRYIRGLAWPAVEMAPALENERYLQQGSAFHHLAQQFLLGVPAEALSGMQKGEELEQWWGNFLRFAQAEDGLGRYPQDRRYPEISLTAPMEGFRLVAKYDLVALNPGGGAVIYDWKTSRRQPRKENLARRLQTRVYPYLLVRAGEHLNGGQRFEPQDVEMVYWLTNFPQQPVRFPYSDQAYREDEAYLSDLITAISRLKEDQFPKTDQVRRCRFCVYRSLCDRGQEAGNWDQVEEGLDVDLDEGQAFDLDIDFDQIAEIEF